MNSNLVIKINTYILAKGLLLALNLNPTSSMYLKSTVFYVLMNKFDTYKLPFKGSSHSHIYNIFQAKFHVPL